jgi:hypothetical protein
MILPEIHVAIRSYKRAGRVKTLDVVPWGKIWIPESQLDDYSKYYDQEQLITIPDDQDGNTSRKFNAILDNSPSKWTLILDDDVTAIGVWDQADHIYLRPKEIDHLIMMGFILAHELGCRLWGLNQGRDELWYETYKPFNLLAPILGPWTGHLDPVLRYDERVPMKEDYDFFLQNIRKHRKALRLNKYHYLHDHGSMVGGVVSQRTLDMEESNVLRMREKWGDTVFKSGGTAGGKNATGKKILNSRIHVPLPGC